MSSDVHQWLLGGWLVCIILNAMCQAFLLVTKEHNPHTYILYLHLTAFYNRRSCMEVDRPLRECCDAAHFSELARPFKPFPGH